MSDETIDGYLVNGVKMYPENSVHRIVKVVADGAVTKAVAEKDATIEVLADALEDLQSEIRRMATDTGGGFSCDAMDAGDAALRLAGRLP